MQPNGTKWIKLQCLKAGKLQIYKGESDDEYSVEIKVIIT